MMNLKSTIVFLQKHNDEFTNTQNTIYQIITKQHLIQSI